MSTIPPDDPRWFLMGVGLLVVVLDIRGFGLDFANDSLGYALVAVGAVLRRAARDLLPLLVCATAAAAAAVSLFGYGGPVGQLFVFSDRAWDLIASLVAVTGAAVFAAVTLLLRSRSTVVAPGSRGRSVVPLVLGVAAAAHLVLAVGWAALLLSGTGFSGTGGVFFQATAVMIGLLRSLTLVGTLVPTRHET